jgi:arabinose-5-phosphate isomerase
MGDALAIALLESRGFTEQDFARSHPGGTLGRRLLLHAGDLMHTNDEIPAVAADVPLSRALLEMTQKGLGMTAIVDADFHVLGVYTDGDLRRTLDRGADVHTTPIRDVMTPGGKTIAPETLAGEAVKLMQQHKITVLLVTDPDGRLTGVLHMHDLLRAGVV